MLKSNQKKLKNKLLDLNLNNNKNIENKNFGINERYPEKNDVERNENKKLNEKEGILNYDLCENIL